MYNLLQVLLLWSYKFCQYYEYSWSEYIYCLYIDIIECFKLLINNNNTRYWTMNELYDLFCHVFVLFLKLIWDSDPRSCYWTISKGTSLQWHHLAFLTSWSIWGSNPTPASLLKIHLKHVWNGTNKIRVKNQIRNLNSCPMSTLRLTWSRSINGVRIPACLLYILARYLRYTRDLALLVTLYGS